MKSAGEESDPSEAAAPPRRPSPSGTTKPLGTDWLFGGRLVDARATRPEFDDTDFHPVTLPHCVAPLSWRDWDPATWEGEWIYRRHFDLPQCPAGQRVFLDFQGVLSGATPWLNGHRLEPHLGGYLPFSHEITGLTRERDNLLAVTVDSRWLPVPPNGHPDGAPSVDYFQPGGIYRGVSVRTVPPAFVADVFAKPLDVLDPARRRVEVDCTIDAAAPPARPVRVELELRHGERVVSRTTVEAESDAAGRTVVRGTLTGLSEVRLWSVTEPHLYEVVATLVADGRPVHTHRARIGFREARFENGGFFLNGQRLKLFGVNRHQIYPYAGMAMPDRVERRDAEILRNELNCTMVRCAHYPQSAAFMDACDELGLLVFEEIPGWQYVGDEAWQELAVRDVEGMVLRDRNRPSVVTWGVQINESGLHPELYTRTRDLARELDPTRQTTGAMLAVHYSATGFVQDLFSYNDYPHPDLGAALRPPLPDISYLVTEAIGSLAGPHFYRRTDPQDVQARQAHLHAEAHDRAAADDRYAGLLAWQAFDYDSLNGFTDHRLKCNGIADTFRVPKLGAAVYRAQTDPRARPVIEPAFHWDFGPQSPPDGPGAAAMICSNCERLEVFVGGEHRATARPDTEGFGHLPYPPSFVDLVPAATDAGRLPDLRIDGYLDGRRVLSREFSAYPALDVLSLAADDTELAADGSDATRVVFRAVDRYGAPRPYAGGEIALDLRGPGEILGDNPFPLAENGGVGAVWVRTRPGETGKIRLTATHPYLGSATVAITAVPPEE